MLFNAKNDLIHQWLPTINHRKTMIVPNTINVATIKFHLKMRKELLVTRRWKAITVDKVYELSHACTSNLLSRLKESTPKLKYIAHSTMQYNPKPTNSLFAAKKIINKPIGAVEETISNRDALM